VPGSGVVNKRITFKDNGSITGCKADEKFSIEGQGAFKKEKNVQDLVNEKGKRNASTENGGTKYSPFRSQRQGNPSLQSSIVQGKG